MTHYRWLSVFSILTVAALASLATPLGSPWDDVKVKHAWEAVPDNWESIGHPPSDTTTVLYIALKPQNEDALIDALYEVSTPGHPKYGAHFSREEAAQLVAPRPETLELVHLWLSHHGVPSSSISATHGANWLTLTDVPISQANKLLGASYKLYRQAGTNDTPILRTVGYGLPTVLHAHVETVAPTTLFASSRTLQQTPHMHPVGGARAPAKTAPRELVRKLSGRDETVVVAPDYLRWLYKTYAYVPRAVNRNALGIVGLLDQFPSPLDLNLFMSLFLRNAQPVTFAVALVNGGWYDRNRPGPEANLNMQYTEAIAYPTPHIFYSTGGIMEWETSSGRPLPNDCFLEWALYVISQSYIPQTISISYSFYERIVPAEYAHPVCRLFALIAVRGASVLLSSGNSGVGPGEEVCKDNTGRVQFMPRFPASCPWLTSVGGTTSARPEVAADISGGGFSNHFPIPSYQRVAIPNFVRSINSQYRGLYNPAGRGYPDISAQALNIEMVHKTLLATVSGTSAAAPIAAGIISLLNDYLISNGRPPLGFLNYWLYSYAREGLSDITSGTNPGCGTEGFSATEGWDPVTGVGTPDFMTLVRLLYTSVVAPGNQGRELQNISNADAPTRDAEEIEKYFRFNSSNWPPQ